MSKTTIPAGGIADDAISEEHIDATVITGTTALAATPAFTDEVLISDGGTIKRMDFSHIFNVPFFKFRSDGQTISNSTDTLIQFDTEIEKSSGSAAFDTTNHRYVPTTAGRYIVNVAVRIDEDATGDRFILQIRKNGTVSTVIDQDINDLSSIQATALIECNGSSDYIDAIISQNTGSNVTIANQAAYSFFVGYRIIA